MTSLILVIAVTAFSAGAAAAVFLMIVIGIRKADHPRRAPTPRTSHSTRPAEQCWAPGTGRTGPPPAITTPTKQASTRPPFQQTTPR
jgi:hypothetical protein